MTLKMKMENFPEYQDVDIKDCIKVEFPNGLQMFPGKFFQNSQNKSTFF